MNGATDGVTGTAEVPTSPTEFGRRKQPPPPYLPRSLLYKIYNKAICNYLEGNKALGNKVSGILKKVFISIDSEILQQISHVALSLLFIAVTAPLGTSGIAVRICILAAQCFDLFTSEQSDIKNPDYQPKVSLFAASTISFTMVSGAALYYGQATTPFSHALNVMIAAHAAFWSLSLLAAELIPDSFFVFFKFVKVLKLP